MRHKFLSFCIRAAINPPTSDDVWHLGQELQVQAPPPPISSKERSELCKHTQYLTTDSADHYQLTASNGHIIVSAN